MTSQDVQQRTGTSSTSVSATSEPPVERYDAIIIGAGMSGMYQLYRLRALGLSVRVFEAGEGVGGTWYWNRYPGARFDSESWTYGYSFDDELLQQWEWNQNKRRAVDSASKEGCIGAPPMPGLLGATRAGYG